MHGYFNIAYISLFPEEFLMLPNSVILKFKLFNLSVNKPVKSSNFKTYTN